MSRSLILPSATGVNLLPLCLTTSAWSSFSSLDFNSDEWHVDETVVKIRGVKYYIWFVVDSETRFVLGFHLSPHRDSPQAFSLLNSAKELGQPLAIVSDRYAAYNVPVKSIFIGVKHIRVESFKDDISNNIIESFNCLLYTSPSPRDGLLPRMP